ncbi:hypothetical protein KBD33_03845 [Candidatus Gracilibacteria bacterium]|nr:hypothetical protein [Candidatus Gracilibacteria bacterium]
MSHIASDSFYRDKHESIRKLSEGNVVFLIEGVGSGSEESHDRFNQSLGFQFDRDLYPTLAQIAGLSVQSGSVLFDGIAGEKLINIDMNIDEIAGLLPPVATLSGTLTPPVINLSGELRALETLSQSESEFLESIFRAFLNWSIVNMADIDRISLADKKELFDIILGKRNQKIVDYIVANPNKDIVIVYGALHYPGIMQSLVYHDKKWKIENYTNHAPYTD